MQPLISLARPGLPGLAMIAAPLSAQVSNPAFDVATVKPSNPETAGPVIAISAGRITLTGFTLKQLIEYAYWIHADQVLGAGGWMDSDKFDIVGQAETGFVSEDLRRQMLRTLLADRFSLRFHHHAKQLQAFVLSAGKNGSRMKARTARDNGPGFRLVFEGASLPGRNASMAQLAFVLQMVVLDRPVVDETRLAGNFDFNLTRAPEETQFGGRGANMPSRADSPDLFTAIREQPGLNLRSQRLPVDVVVVDRAGRPGAN